MIEQGLMLMLTGMGVVFLFLAVLVCVMRIAATFFKKHPSIDNFLKTDKKKNRRNSSRKKTNSKETSKLGKESEAEIAAVVAAVQSFMRAN